MGDHETSMLLAQLRSASSYSEQAAALRSLKNEIVGHTQKKEALVAAGVLEPIVRMLSASSSSSKLNGKDSRFNAAPTRTPTEEEAVRLQAVQALSTIASGGSPFLPPLHATGSISAILATLSPLNNSPHVVYASLRALTILADAAAVAPAGSPCDLQILADSLFIPAHIHSLQSILLAAPHDSLTQSQITLAADLISRLCHDVNHKLALSKANGILDALATRLAGFIISDGLVIPGAEWSDKGQQGDAADCIPVPAPRLAKIAPILNAIAVVIGDSRYRAFMLLTSPAILAVLPVAQFIPAQAVRAAWQVAGLSTSGNGESLGAMDYLLPPMPQRGSRRARRKSAEPKERKATSITSVHEHIRSESYGQGADSQSGDGDLPESPSSQTMIATIIIPNLLQLMRDHLDKPCNTDARFIVDGATKETWEILERAPVLLARLIVDHDVLQQASYDCKAIEVLSKLLQESYKPAVSSQPKMWSPNPEPGMDMDEYSPTCKLGPAGELPLLQHRIRLRESALRAIAASLDKEDYRRALMELDAVPYVVESLSVYPGKPSPVKERPRRQGEQQSGDAQTTAKPEYGTNPPSVLIGACNVVRMLSRSVSVLRTALVDYEVFVPILKYTKHPVVDVQIAAMAVMVNLVTNVSPMREALIDQGVMTVLCEHTRSSNPSLRLNALWALKHLVLEVGPTLKKAVVEELSPGLLCRLICDDTEDNALVSSRAATDSPSFSSEGVDLDDDVDMQHLDDLKGFVFGSSTGAPQELGRGRTRIMEDRLARYRESELNPVRKARNDDLAIQEQGLDLIRNLITGTRNEVLDQSSPSETTEMLRPKVIRPFSRRNSGREARMIYPQAKLIEIVIYVLVHIAASVPRHRQLVIAQTNMLKQLGAHFNSKEKYVRAALCQLVTNLTWQDDADDATGCNQRAQELKRLGFLAKLESLHEDDPELDVKERAKGALWQMKKGY
ncbi:unnamed protein product [Parascedosporium putredinis]|uniref:Armadillo repeat-containing protein 8 n=1 Tax=Parascedosporium putredinis TaxID=1442378 RepID=A0A9P1H5P2_9PEZI|nr:unnamed protein product [Parascedosporium putredinis]CAI7999520.1 unnamed protein product [Parascedosporium putredinis]